MRDLIYFSIGNDAAYCDLCNICIKSLQKFGRYEGEYLILLQKGLKPDNKLELQKDNIFHIEGNVFGNKFRIFEYSKINEYDRIMYIDCDTFFTNNVYNIFNKIDQNFLTCDHNSKDFLMDNEYCGEELFNNDEKKFVHDNKLTGLNSGMFGFRPSNKNIDVLKLACEKQKICRKGWDQPAFNYAILKSGKYDIIENIVHYKDSSDHEDNLKKEMESSINDGIIFWHFCGGPGVSYLKYDKMIIAAELLR